MLESGEKADVLIKKLGLEVENDDTVLIPIIIAAIANNPKAVKDIKEGNGKAIGALIGYCMKETKGKADPQMLSALVMKQLGETNNG